jgi:hypothetical protein
MCRSTYFLSLALNGLRCSSSRPGRFTRRGRSPRNPLDRRLGGPQNRSWRRGEKPWPSAIQPVAIPASISGQTIGATVNVRMLVVVPYKSTFIDEILTRHRLGMPAGSISQVLHCIFIEMNAAALPIKTSERSHPVSQNRFEEGWRNDSRL